MSQFADQLKQAFLLRKDKKPGEAIAIYQVLWPQQAALFNEWDGWSYGQCLRETKQYVAALDTCRQLYLRYKTSEMIQQLYSWCIYYTELAGEKQPAGKEGFLKVLDAIVHLSTPGSSYSPAVKSIFKLIKFLAEGHQNDWCLIGEWLQKLDKDTLSKETYSIDVPGKGRKMELASELEEWYSWQSKYLLQTRQWDNCIKLCDEALAKLQKWHYSNDVWFARRKVAALTQLGHKAKALEVLRPLIKRKREWFMLADLAELTDDHAVALALYAEAAMAYGEMSKKIRIFFKMALLYQQLDDAEMANAHAMLVLALRKENNWPVPEELEKILKETGGFEGKFPTSSSMVKKLQPIWQKKSSGLQYSTVKMQPVRTNGTIDYVLANGQAGFIKTDKAPFKIYFLFRNFRGEAEELKPGLKVSFEVINSFDKKKNREATMAVGIEKNNNQQ